MRIGLGLGITNARAASAPVYDPSVLSLTGWWPGGNFSAGTWTGKASAGNSSSHNLAPGSAPSSTTLNGKAVPQFDGAAQYITGAATTTYLSTSALSGWVLINVPSLASVGHNADTRFNESILCTAGSGQFWLYLVDTGKVGIGVSDGGNKTAEATFTANTWQLVQFRYTAGGLIEVRVNGGSWSTAAVGTIASLANTFQVARSITGTFLGCTIADIGTAQATTNDAGFDNIRNYINGTYGVTV